MERQQRAVEIVDRLQSLALEQEIGDILDLYVLRPDDPKPSSTGGLEIESPEAHELFGRDGAGGGYYVLRDGRILYVDSEGSFGIVGTNFKEFIAIATGLPGWHDALKPVKLQSIDVAREKWRSFVDKWGAEDELDEPWPDDEGFKTGTPAEARAAIREHFGVEPLADPFGALHHAVRTLGKDISVKWGSDPAQSF
ncbi:hypothetical protein HFO74_15420 [Rhizobium laguerreae]|uniref:SUKH-4 immunity protein of toxin-antitoxin system n=1 Tax=Rhizobium laguerreae TaxID=1076926 RepID=A0AB35FEM5_9HYPH|nr:hypothetical protein [Rhizobium laguerreae]MBY3064800.1 hypothetical protein [Rhizobium laguerreae]